MAEPSINPYSSYADQSITLQDAFEKVVTTNERTIRAMKKGLAPEYARLLTQLKTIVADANQKYSSAGKLNYQELQRYKRLGGLEKEINAAIKDNYGRISERVIKDQSRIISNTYKIATSAIAEVSGAPLDPNIASNMVGNILSKPWTGVSLPERMFLRQQYLGVQIRGQIVRDTLGEGSTYQEMSNNLKKVILKDYSSLGSESESMAHQFQSDTEQEVLNAAGEENIQLTKTWVTMSDDRVRDAHEALDGQTVDVQDMFEVPSGEYQGFKADGPGLFGIDALDRNCRCYMVTDVKLKED